MDARSHNCKSHDFIPRYDITFKKTRFKVSSAKRRPFCLGLNVFKDLSTRLKLATTLETPPTPTHSSVPSYYWKQCWHINQTLQNIFQLDFIWDWKLLIQENAFENVWRVATRPFSVGLNVLPHWGWVMLICISNLTIIGLDNGLSPMGPNHYLNQCWNTVNWTLRNKLQ